MRNAYGGKTRQPRRQDCVAESHTEGGAITVASPHMPSLAAEKQRKTPEGWSLLFGAGEKDPPRVAI